MVKLQMKMQTSTSTK